MGMNAQQAADLMNKNKIKLSFDDLKSIMDESIEFMAGRGHNVTCEQFGGKYIITPETREEIVKHYENEGYTVSWTNDYLSIRWGNV